jgi:hypothetical protein
MSEAAQAELRLIETELIDVIKMDVARCFAAEVKTRTGSITFRYTFERQHDAWVLADGDEALDLVDSTIPAADDDAALACMRRVVRGAAFPADDAHGTTYRIFWTWRLS